MAIYQICFKPLVVPSQEKEFKVGQIYQKTITASDQVLDWDVCLKKQGLYKLEYWAVNEMELETSKKIVEVNSSGFVEPKPISGATFTTPCTPESQELVLQKDGISVVFSKQADRLGKDFDWNELDLAGLQAGKSTNNTTVFVNIQSGSWLSKQLNNERKLIEVRVKAGKKIFLQSHLLTKENGTLKDKLPSCYKHIIAKSWINGENLCFLIRQAGLFIIEA